MDDGLSFEAAMTVEPRRIYLFRSDAFTPTGDTIACAAPVDLVVAAYGGGGYEEQDGIQAAFGGNAFWRDELTGDRFLGVWGARNASRFRTALRKAGLIVIVRAQPPARLAWLNKSKVRPRSRTSSRTITERAILTPSLPTHRVSRRGVQNPRSGDPE